MAKKKFDISITLKKGAWTVLAVGAISLLMEWLNNGYVSMNSGYLTIIIAVLRMAQNWLKHK